MRFYRCWYLDVHEIDDWNFVLGSQHVLYFLVFGVKRMKPFVCKETVHQISVCMSLKTPVPKLFMTSYFIRSAEADRILTLAFCSWSSVKRMLFDSEIRSFSCLKFPFTFANVGMSLCFMHLVIKPTFLALLCSFDVVERKFLNKLEKKSKTFCTVF